MLTPGIDCTNVHRIHSRYNRPANLISKLFHFPKLFCGFILSYEISSMTSPGAERRHASIVPASVWPLALLATFVVGMRLKARKMCKLPWQMDDYAVIFSLVNFYPSLLLETPTDAYDSLLLDLLGSNLWELYMRNDK